MKNDVYAPVVKTLFIPEGNPGVQSVHEIRAIPRIHDAQGDSQEITITGEMDISITYLPMRESDHELPWRTVNFEDEGDFTDTEPDEKVIARLESALREEDDFDRRENQYRDLSLNVPFTLAIGTEDLGRDHVVKLEPCVHSTNWFVVSPKAIEFEAVLQLAPQEELEAEEMETGEQDDFAGQEEVDAYLNLSRTEKPVQKAVPVQKVEPVQKAEALQKVEPVQKAESEEITELEEKAESEEITEPIQITEPVQKAGSAQRTESMQKTKPVQKVEPVQEEEEYVKWEAGAEEKQEKTVPVKADQFEAAHGEKETKLPEKAEISKKTAAKEGSENIPPKSQEKESAGSVKPSPVSSIKPSSAGKTDAAKKSEINKKAHQMPMVSKIKSIFTGKEGGGQKRNEDQVSGPVSTGPQTTAEQDYAESKGTFFSSKEFIK